jgi:hypothetical protein
MLIHGSLYLKVDSVDIFSNMEFVFPHCWQNRNFAVEAVLSIILIYNILIKITTAKNMHP